MPIIAIVDYGMGNVRSVANAVDYCGFDPEITALPDRLAAASHVILPGVGAFGDAIGNLRARGLIDALNREVLEKGKPFLGICLGMQVLARSSEEHGQHLGLGWFEADVLRLRPADRSLKIPHMGWNAIEPTRPHSVIAVKASEPTFYFVHGYHVRCDDPADVVAVCDYGGPVTAAIARDNIVATQFHPEKSQDNGIEVLTNFLRWKI